MEMVGVRRAGEVRVESAVRCLARSLPQNTEVTHDDTP